jgi:hypothetical protein
MPPKKKNNAADEEAKFMRAARFGRVKNTLSMGFGALYRVTFDILSWYKYVGLSLTVTISFPFSF